MRRRFTLQAPRADPAGGRGPRARRFLLHTWAGRVLLAAAALWALELAGLPLPQGLRNLDHVILVGFGIYGIVRFGRFIVRRLLWRIRSKMIVSYLFIGVVPLVLLVLFFFIGGLISLVLVASYIVSSQLERSAQELLVTARTARSGLAVDDPRVGSVLEERLAPTRSFHPGLAYALVVRGRTVAAAGDAPRELPSWLRSNSFAGIAQPKNGRAVLRAVWPQAESFLVLDVPFDDALCARVEERTGIAVVPGIRLKTTETTEEKRGEVRVSMQTKEAGMHSFALIDHTDWTTGKADLEPLQIRFQPFGLIRRLAPSQDMGDVLLVKGMTIVGGLFLVVYVVALGLGLLLARSITKSVHALSRGTERLRQGDFSHTIPIGSRDQLGELAESFNMMARGIEDLLREQAEKERLEEELRIARQIQMSLLPQNTVSLPGVRVAALCLPAAEVGGDYYDLLPLSESRLGVLVADVSGKGTSAALYMAELKGLVLSLSRIYASPAKLLSEANRILAVNMDSRSFITMTYAVVDVAARTMRYARAGHNPIIHLPAATGHTRVLTPQGLGLGIDRGERFEEVLEEAELPLKSGDLFLFFTDGLSEAMNSRAELFGESRLRRVMEESEAYGSDEGVVKDRILEEIRSFVGEAAQHDDMTMVILKVV